MKPKEYLETVFDKEKYQALKAMLKIC